MSQFGMQMPAGRVRRGPSIDAMTALAGFAVLCLAAACIVMWSAGSKVGKGGFVFGIQDAGKIDLPKSADGSAPAAPSAPAPASKKAK